MGRLTKPTQAALEGLMNETIQPRRSSTGASTSSPTRSTAPRTRTSRAYWMTQQEVATLTAALGDGRAAG